MAYNKNNGLKKAGILKHGGAKELPLTGATIAIESDIENIHFVDRPDEKLLIYGSYTIEHNGKIVASEEIDENMMDYFNELILNCQIKCVSINRKKCLTIEISTAPEMKIFVDATKFEYPIEQWEYQRKNGYLTN